MGMIVFRVILVILFLVGAYILKTEKSDEANWKLVRIMNATVLLFVLSFFVPVYIMVMAFIVLLLYVFLF